jgi:DNA-directed RNA polymerase specialized sigma54-like protein
MTLTSLALADSQSARVVRITDTLSLARMEVSDALREEVQRNPLLTCASEPVEMRFDTEGNLPPAF